jgi:pyruvate formate lyase activating enzyme
MTVDEVIDEIMKDEDFYRNSGGGVTISGGEALWQSRFVATLLAECKQKGLHTALDTTGYSSWEKMSCVVNFADLILFDIKHLDLFQHRKVTGVENTLILENLQKIAKMLPTWIRVPLIAGFNDSMDHIRQVALLGEQLGIEKISLLPYHEGGKSKSVQLGRAYTCSELEAPTDEHVQKLKNMIEDHDISVLIGR